jgi:type II secretory pathway pseudopilin PulG
MSNPLFRRTCEAKKKEKYMYPVEWKAECGFSLLEVLVVLAGMLMLIALTLDPFNRFVEEYRLEMATQSLTAALELARHTAIAKNKESVVAFYPADSYYEVFPDINANRLRDPGEPLLFKNSLPKGVAFDGTGLWGPPASPDEMVSDPVSFSSHRIVFNPQGKLGSGTGTVYLRNKNGDARAISYNIASRLKVYVWQKKSTTWK